MKLIHTGDAHYSRDKAKDVFASLDVISQHASSVDLIVIAGDVWDSPVQNTGASGFPEFVERMSVISNQVPIVMVQGTPSHDADGSLDIFEQASSRITVLQIGVPYFLHTSGLVENQVTMSDASATALIFGMPEPQKKWLLANHPDKTLDEAVRTIFLGLAAIRQKYPELPCILVYHGQVRGARMGGGQTAEHGVSIDDLAIVGADYIAMADIHLPQRVGESRGLEAHYCGAWHPTADWKDSDYQFGFNKVSLIRENPSVWMEMERVDFPHPILTKVTSIEQCTRENLSGKRVWLELTINKGESVDTVEVLKDLKEKFGAVDGSRVTTKTKPTQTVRAGEIKNLTKLRDKFKLWADNSQKPFTAQHLEYADLLESEAQERGVITKNGRFWFYKLNLRGAKGIWKNQKKDTVTFDLRNFQDGVVGLLGPNGHGKSTIMNNFHMWPELPNFDLDPLYKHFRLEDSFRECLAMNLDTGMHYRGLIKVNAPAKKTEAYLFQSPDGETWEPVGETNGRIKTYEDEVVRIFGTLEMYLRTAFMMQNSTAAHPDLSRASKSTKQQIMAELAGIDHFAAYKTSANEKCKELDRSIDLENARAESMTGSLKDRSVLEMALAAGEQQVKSYIQSLPLIEAEGKTLAAEVELLSSKVIEQKNALVHIRELSEKMESTINDRDKAQYSITSFSIARDDKENLEKDISSYDVLKERESAALIEIEADNKKHQDAISEWSESVKSHDDQTEVLRNIQGDLSAQISRGQIAIGSAKSEISTLEREIAEGFADTCPVCKQSLPPENLERYHNHVAEVADKIVKLKEALKTTEESCAQKRLEITQASDNLASHIEKRPAMPEKMESPAIRDLADIRKQLTIIDINRVRKELKLANEATIRIEELEKRVAEYSASITSIQSSITDLQFTIDDTVSVNYETKKSELDSKRREYSEKSTSLARIQESVKNISRDIQDHDSKVQEINGINAVIDVKRANLADWKLIEQAMSQNGIQALELDAVCPNISNTATILLEEYQSGRYSIRLDTQRVGGAGNQIEDFIIWICDSATGEEQEFETLSGGERVWINKALTDAFAIVKQQNAGTQFLTGFADESDGALDMESKLLFYRLVGAGHQSSGRKHTVFVSHDVQIVDVIEQKILVTEL